MDRPKESIIVDVKNRYINQEYKKCDSWSPISNTLYLYFGIPMLVTMILIMVLVIIYCISYIINKNTNIDDMFNNRITSFVFLLISLIPIYLTYKHVTNIKKECYQYGQKTNKN